MTPLFPVKTPVGPLGYFGQRIPEFALREDRVAAVSGDKCANSLEEVFDFLEIEDGQVLSFHHHYRNGDRLLNAVIAIAQARCIKGLTICPSSVFPVHAPLVSALRDGTIAHVLTDYMRGPLADAIAGGGLHGFALLQTHGGRARAISSGQIDIDVAFIGAALAHVEGAATGRGGEFACGPLGYPAVDARYARKTVVAAHEVVDTRLPREDIPAAFVDHVVALREPGDIAGIRSGSTVPSATPAAQTIGARVATAIKAAGLLDSAFSIQSGAGGYSLGCMPYVGKLMAENSVVGSFLSGGITGAHCELLEAGLFQDVFDVQCFDLAAVRSSISNPAHHMMSATDYASPLNANARVDSLSVMLLGAVEVDVNFNVNVVTGADGRLLGGPGGHPDAAQGAKLSIVTTTLTGGGFAKIVPKVRTLTTLGENVDLVVTDHGVAINDRREDLKSALTASGLRVVSMEELAAKSASLADKSAPETERGPPRIFVEHRDGVILDWI
ncbi:MAG: citrate lyase subunit alpha [Pseudomonadota bacterium]